MTETFELCPGSRKSIATFRTLAPSVSWVPVSLFPMCPGYPRGFSAPKPL